VNDATGGAHDKENAMRVSADMKRIIGHGKFKFKETIVSGDPLYETGELRKVLGSGGTQRKDKICVDIKLNYGEKIKDAYME
jgi:hypothetical protein